jgi:hypothetical protein
VGPRAYKKNNPLESVPFVLVSLSHPGKGSWAASGAVGITSESRNETFAATNETAAAWTWSKQRLPKMIERREEAESRAPTFAAVPSRAERFISRLPFRLRITGMIIMSSLTRVIARQC